MTKEAHEIIEEIQSKAWQAGWNALADKIREALKVEKPRAAKKAPTPFRPGTTAAKVYECVKATPGLTGSEIIANAGVEDKTARTALHRMKVRGIAVNENGRWRIL